MRLAVPLQVANSQGIYAVKFFAAGSWRVVVVDDRYLATVRRWLTRRSP